MQIAEFGAVGPATIDKGQLKPPDIRVFDIGYRTFAHDERLSVAPRACFIIGARRSALVN